MKIGLVTIFQPHDLADLLDQSSRRLLPEIAGVTSTPVTPMAREWLRMGHELCVFTLDPSVTRPYLLKGNRLVIHVLPKRRARHYLFDCYKEERRLIRAAVASESPEVLSAQWSYEHALAALDCGLPTAVTCHDTPFRCAWIAKHWHATYHLLLAWKVIRKADSLICVSPYTVRHIRRYFRPRCPVYVIPNGLNLEIFKRGARRLEHASSIDRPYTICSVGRWGKLKNIPTLLKAFALLPKGQGGARLVLYGPGMGKGEQPEQWARERGLHGKVEFRGSAPREVILDFLENEADLMVHTSLIETHGMVLIEAIACGVIVVGGRYSGAVPWTLEEGRSGFLCDVRDVGDLARTIVRARNQKVDEKRDMKLHAWNYVSENFRIEDAASANVHVLSELKNNKNTTA
jgi:glycosyltransferase involved in cell wall biosynthesis